MSAAHPILAVRFSRIRAAIDIAADSERRAENAVSDPVMMGNWMAHDAAIAGLMGLTCTPEGIALMNDIQSVLEGRK